MLEDAISFHSDQVIKTYLDFQAIVDHVQLNEAGRISESQTDPTTFSHLGPSHGFTNPQHPFQLFSIGICQQMQPVLHGRTTSSDYHACVPRETLTAILDFGRIVTLPANRCKNTELQSLPNSCGKSSRSRMT